MKLHSIAAGVLLSLPAMGLADSVPVTVQNIFQPLKTFEGENAYIIVEGTLPGSCFDLLEPMIAMDTEQTHLKLTVLADQTSEEGCNEIGKPFQYKIDLGQIPAGDYQIDINQSVNATHIKIDTFDASCSTESVSLPCRYGDIAGVSLVRAPLLPRYWADVNVSLHNSCEFVKEVFIYVNGHNFTVVPQVVMLDEVGCVAQEKTQNVRVLLGLLRRNQDYFLHVKGSADVDQIFTAE